MSAGDKEVGNDQLTDDPDFMASDEPPDEFHDVVAQNNKDLYRNSDQSESDDKEDDEA